MANNLYTIPRANSMAVDAQGFPTREWYNYWRQSNPGSGGNTPSADIAALAEALGSPDGTVASIPKTQVQGKNSVQQLSYFPHVTLQLVNDVAAPGDVMYYGTNTTGNRGFFAVSDAFADSATVTKTVVGGVTSFNASSSGVPYYMPDATTFTVPLYTQDLFTIPITLVGSALLVVNGILVEV